jgi:tetratricopeptide (TPR) repeat protein
MYAFNPNRKGLTEVKILGLQTWRLYPALAGLNRDFLLNHGENRLRVDQSTPIASIGSCFAREIKLWLIDNGYTYLQTATGPCTESGSARYDRVFNTFSIRQEFERAYGEFSPETTCWRVIEDGVEHLLSPYRYCLAWDSEDEMHRELAEHKSAVQAAFNGAKVLIITVGQSEIWYDKRDGSVFPMVPPTDIFDPEVHGFRISTYQENLDNLNRSYELLKANNPDIHVLITVSPVPLRATFRQENSVIADTAGKSMLRAVVDEFVRTQGDDVTYFPAYEVVRCLTENPWKSDARHVTRETVASIMSLFEEWFVKEQSSLSPMEKFEIAEAAYGEAQYAKAAIHLEEVLQDVAENPDALSDSDEHLWVVYERLAMSYYANLRHGEAYEMLKKAVEIKPETSARWDEVLGNICAMAISHRDFESVPQLLKRLLANPTAPLATFFHWVKLLDEHRGADTARTVLSDAVVFAPRITMHPSYTDCANRYGIERAS